jgi:hypothetical protein
VESWNYKTFAILYYGKTQPRQFNGIWSKTAKQDHPEEHSPNFTARKHWIVQNPVSFPVTIITCCDYKADTSFLKHFSRKSEAGAYWLWEKNTP